jgi:hypothetical protein
VAFELPNLGLSPFFLVSSLSAVVGVLWKSGTTWT